MFHQYNLLRTELTLAIKNLHQIVCHHVAWNLCVSCDVAELHRHANDRATQQLPEDANNAQNFDGLRETRMALKITFKRTMTVTFEIWYLFVVSVFGSIGLTAISAGPSELQLPV